MSQKVAESSRPRKFWLFAAIICAVVSSPLLYHLNTRTQMTNSRESKPALKSLSTNVELTMLDGLSNAMSEYARTHGFSFHRGALPKLKYYMTLWMRRDDALIFLGTDENLVINATRGIDPNRITGPIKIVGSLYSGDKRQVSERELNQITDEVANILKSVSTTGDVQVK